MAERLLRLWDHRDHDYYGRSQKLHFRPLFLGKSDILTRLRDFRTFGLFISESFRALRHQEPTEIDVDDAGDGLVQLIPAGCHSAQAVQKFSLRS